VQPIRFIARIAGQSSKVKAAGMGANGIAFMQLVA
jgi:hypothetical protein